MQEKQNITILWFSHDLRVEDNPVVNNALQANLPIIAIYVFDPSLMNPYILDIPKMSKYRANFILESLQDLEKQLQTLHIPLIAKQIDLASFFSTLEEKYNIKEVYLTKHWNSEEVNAVNKVKELLPKTHFKESYTQFLIDPNQLPFPIQDLPKVFTSFRKKVEVKVEVKTIEPLPFFKNSLQNPPISSIPTLTDLGYSTFTPHPNNVFPFKGGTTSALERINHYFWQTKNLSSYKETRNGLIGEDYSSKLSPWLACGAISAKMIYRKVKKYEAEVQKNSSTYWLIFELLWRDYFKYVSLKYGDKIYQLKGIFDREIKPYNFKKGFEQWAKGETSESFVNANMKELNATGFMSNRGRQNVASYLAKTVGVNWLWGAKYFEGMLIDYDPDSNYGNWMYVAGTGNDPRDRVFNVKLQAERYDPNNTYQDLWL